MKKIIVIATILALMLVKTVFATDVNVNSQSSLDSQNLTERENTENDDSVTEEVKGMVNVEVLNVRSGPSTDYEKIGTLLLGTTIEIVSEEEDWFEIIYDNLEAYLFKEYVTIIDGSGNGSSIVEYANAFLGTPYLAGGNTAKGFDCSGFVQYVMSNFGITMPRTSTDQYSTGTKVSKSELLPGDLVFFKYSKNSSKLDHVGIYVGEGKFIHSPVPGQTVKYSPLLTGYFANNYYGATRIFN